MSTKTGTSLKSFFCVAGSLRIIMRAPQMRRNPSELQPLEAQLLHALWLKTAHCAVFLTRRAPHVHQNRDFVEVLFFVSRRAPYVHKLKAVVRLLFLLHRDGGGEPGAEEGGEVLVEGGAQREDEVVRSGDGAFVAGGKGL